MRIRIGTHDSIQDFYCEIPEETIERIKELCQEKGDVYHNGKQLDLTEVWGRHYHDQDTTIKDELEKLFDVLHDRNNRVEETTVVFVSERW